MDRLNLSAGGDRDPEMTPSRLGKHADQQQARSDALELISKEKVHQAAEDERRNGKRHAEAEAERWQRERTG